MHHKFAPFQYMTGRRQRSWRKVYGCHIQINQLLHAQQVDVTTFLSRASAAGWHILYMTRKDIVRQSISTILATRQHQWYSYDRQRIDIQPQHIEWTELERWLQRRIGHRQMEEEALQDLPHLTVVYERDLLDATCHQLTMDRVFKHIGVPPMPVAAQTERLGGDLHNIVLNYGELIEQIRHSPFAQQTDLC